MANLAELEPRGREILRQEQKTYEEANPKSRAEFERSVRVLPGGVTRTL
jgi:hypothetical protein